MTSVDPQVDPAFVPPGSRPIMIAKDQVEYLDLPAIVTPRGVVITRWALSLEERRAIVEGADIYLTIWGTPIRPVHLNVGPCDWREV